jgi:hypothetical protein
MHKHFGLIAVTLAVAWACGKPTSDCAQETQKRLTPVEIAALPTLEAVTCH